MTEAVTELQKILLVEDDHDIQEIAILSLESIGGYEVKATSSGKEALELLKNYHPQLILLDVMMPEMDGPTVFKKLRETPEHKDTPVIFMTAKVQQNEVKSYYDIGAIGVISKPFSPVELPQTILKIWQKSNS